jgi:hypothetical protein
MMQYERCYIGGCARERNRAGPDGTTLSTRNQTSGTRSATRDQNNRLSPSTASVDRIVKNQEYRDTPSILRYVMLEQAQMAATVFSRQGDDWAGAPCRG